MNLLLDLGAHPVIGHRGAAGLAPENTLEGLELGLERGAEALEFDVHRSEDGVAMVIHDSTLDRTTDLRGPVRALTVAELKRADAGYRFGGAWRGRGVRIPTLREVIEAFPDVPLLIELKHAEVADAVARALRDGKAEARAVIAGEDARGLCLFAAPPFHRGASRRDISRLFFGFGAPDPACRAYSVPERWHGLVVPSRRFVRAAGRRESTVHVWTVDDAASAVRVWTRGVHGIVTNRPDLIRTVRDQHFGTASR